MPAVRDELAATRAAYAGFNDSCREYMASGVPLVSSDLPVLREVLKDGKNSLLVPPRDVTAWVTAIDRFAADPTFAERVGASAHEDYQRHYTWAARARELLAAAGELVCAQSSSWFRR